jgi:endogenous inhibitor of DNA gyrase (YacG/DUF329 family)
MKCPTCRQPTEWEDNPSRPFCSERCKLIDFGRWADEEFRVPGAPSEKHVNTDDPSHSPTPDDQNISE